MFSKQQRLPYPEINHIQKAGKNFSSGKLSITVAFSKKPTPRFLTVVPKRAAKTAVQKNKLQRVLRAQLKKMPQP